MTTVRIDVQSHRGDTSVEATFPSTLGGAGELDNIDQLIDFLAHRIRSAYEIASRETE